MDGQSQSIVTSSVATGVGDVLGNKGGVAVTMTCFGKRIVFINSHLAAHRNAVGKRNSDYSKIVNKLTFEVGTAKKQIMSSFDEGDVVCWAGDLNYRIDEFTYEDVIEMIKKGELQKLLGRDQLNKERQASRVFRNFREARIEFNPTYKFDKNAQSIYAYDSSEKKRVPAWCDRILVKDSCSSTPTTDASALPPLPSTKVTCRSYEAMMELNDSDHKPVHAAFTVDIAMVNEPVKRFVVGNALKKAYDCTDDFQEEVHSDHEENEAAGPLLDL